MLSLALLIKIVKYLLIIIAIITVMVFCFLRFAPVLGGYPDDDTLAKMTKIPLYKDGQFTNLEPVIRDGMGRGVPEDERLGMGDFMVNIFFPAKDKHPAKPLPTLPLKDNLPTTNNRFVWLGHSTVLFKMGDKTIITDPVFYRASPVPIGGKAYPMTHTPKTDELPPIDIVLLSHDHYDHLDMRAIREIDGRVGRYLVPLGVKSHLVQFGVDGNKVTEFAWHDSVQLDTLNLTFVPSRHFSGRRFNTKNSTLWGGWVVKSHDFSLYFTGDSGYGKHFLEIGNRYAPSDGFDLMLVENGAYNINWGDIHMMPEESVQAVKDARAKLALPIHWAKFDLAFHAWDEPIKRFGKEAVAQNVYYVTPKIGQNFGTTDDKGRFSAWWETAK